MEFQDELAGGTILVRPALQSPNYVAGVSGWAIKIDGSAEFNNVTVRGTLQSNNYVAGVSGWKLDQAGTAELNQLTARGTMQSSNFVAGATGWQINNSGAAEFNNITLRGGTSIGGSAFYYNGTPGVGTLVLAIAATAGTDPFGNAYADGMTVLGATGTVNITTDTSAIWTNSSGSRIEIGAGGSQALQQLTPPDVGAIVWADGSFGTNITTMLGTSTPSVFIESPTNTAHNAKSSIRLHGGSGTTTANLIECVSQTMTQSGDLTVGGVLTAANVQSGSVTITPTVAGQWTANTTVTFPTAFATTPAVMLTCTAGGPGTGGTTELELTASAVTTTTCAIRIRRDNLTPTTITWLAISTL